MAIKRRYELKERFRSGEIPTEEDFRDLIDSFVNQADDGIERHREKGFRLTSSGEGKRLFTFTTDEPSEAPDWHISVNDGGLSLGNGANENPVLHLSNNGQVGIGLQDPLHRLDVNGTIGMHGRMGYYRFGDIPADGEWHPVIANLNGFHAFEIIALASEKGAHSMMHATCVCTYGESKGGITKTTNYFGSEGNALDVRWDGTPFDFQLQVRSKAAYSPETTIKFNIMKIWSGGEE